jgi:hypothetical protein
MRHRHGGTPPRAAEGGKPVELGGGAFGALAQGLVRLLVQAASAVVLVVLGWKFLAVLLTGGSVGRLIDGLIVSLVIIGVCVAALSNLNMAAGVVLAVGQAVWGAVAEAVRSSV